MKFRKPAFVLAFLMLMIVIWCMTPPETSLAVKITCTIIVVIAYFTKFMQKVFNTFCHKSTPILKFLHTCATSTYRFLGLCVKGVSYFIHLAIIRPLKALMQLVTKFLNSDLICQLRDTCDDKAERLFEFICLCPTKFIGWSIQADPQLAEKNCQTIADLLTLGKQLSHPLYRLKHQFNLTTIFCSISIIIGSISLMLQHNTIPLLILNLFNFIILAIFLTLLTPPLSSPPQPTDLITTAICPILQALVPFSMLLGSIAPEQNPPQVHPLFTPYFTVKLGSVSSTLSIAQLIVIVSAMLAIICYSNLCRTLHEIAHTPPTTYVTSES